MRGGRTGCMQLAQFGMRVWWQDYNVFCAPSQKQAQPQGYYKDTKRIIEPLLEKYGVQVR